MLSKLSCRVLTGVITIPVMLGLAACNGQDVKKSEPVKPAVTSSQVAESGSKDTTKNAEDAGNTSNAGDASKTGNAGNTGKAANSSSQQAVKGKTASSGKGNVKSPTTQKPVKQQTSKSGKTGKSNPGSSKPETNTGKSNNGYKLQPGEVSIDKNNMDKDGSITLGGDEDGNVWHGW